MTERDIARGKTCGRSREYEWYETGVLKKKTEWNRKKGQTGCRCREYDENGKPIRESLD